MQGGSPPLSPGPGREDVSRSRAREEFLCMCLGPWAFCSDIQEQNLWRMSGVERGEKDGEKDEVGGSYKVSARSAQTSSE